MRRFHPYEKPLRLRLARDRSYSGGSGDRVVHAWREREGSVSERCPGGMPGHQIGRPLVTRDHIARWSGVLPVPVEKAIAFLDEGPLSGVTTTPEYQ